MTRKTLIMKAYLEQNPEGGADSDTDTGTEDGTDTTSDDTGK